MEPSFFDIEKFRACLLYTSVEEFLPRYENVTADNIHEIIQTEIGQVFMEVLEDAGVYKRTAEGQAAFDRFTAVLNQ